MGGQRNGPQAAAAQYSAEITHARLRQVIAAWRASWWRYDKRVYNALARAGMPCWLGQKEKMTVADVTAALTDDPTFLAEERAELLRLL